VEANMTLTIKIW